MATVDANTAPAVPDYLASPNAVFNDVGVKWRYGKAPDYSKTRKVWEEGVSFPSCLLLYVPEHEDLDIPSPHACLLRDQQARK
jgi:hypothetical protein